MKRYKGTEQQVTYLNGKEVPYGTPGATRPDVIKNVSGHLEAIEVKNYNLETNSNNLVAELKREIGQRLTNMPKGTTQRIALDIRGRNYQSPFLQSITDKIHYSLRDIYPNIPIDFLT